LINFELIKNEKIKLHIKDIRNQYEVDNLIKDLLPDVIIHLAGQVAVTSSVKNPREDFEINALGTFNILESVRKYNPKTIILFSSTNKVYGDFEHEVIETSKRYKYKDISGINEETLLDFHSPYGCSKGVADQYVRDYHRIYNLQTVVLRQSCVYGINQFGIEDQGWVAWFSIAANYNKKFKIYGNGKQVRDILYVSDLINLYERIIENIEDCSGKIYNVGGGENNTLSLLELVDYLEIKLDKKLELDFENWRPGDQKIYVSDLTKIQKEIGWSPSINYKEGLDYLDSWIKKNEKNFKFLNLI
jgi:CDP-paratose 2-epimerase